MRKFTAAVTALAVLALGGCSDNSVGQAEVTEQVIETEVSETTATAEEITTSETEETTETETLTETQTSETEETDGQQSAKNTSADEEYGVYPMKILYPENIENDFSVDAVVINEEFKNGEFVINKFSAEYPVFSGGDEAVTEKINGYIKNYVDGIYDELERDAAADDTSKYDIDGFPYSMCGFIYERAFDGGYGERALWDVNGNILSVYFEDYEYGAGAMHGYETPSPMVFDLRSGERVDFNKIIGDVAGLSEVLSKTLYDYLYMDPYSTRRDVTDNYAEYNQKRISDGFVYESGVEFGFDEDGDYATAFNKANGRMTVHSGCLCFYLGGYEYGSYADGIRRVDVSINDILPYLNDDGKSLFEGYISAESAPADIIIENGEKYFDKGEKREVPHLYFTDTPGRS